MNKATWMVGPFCSATPDGEKKQILNEMTFLSMIWAFFSEMDAALNTHTVLGKGNILH